MPTYDYQCDACDHKFEIYQGINDEKLKKCPQCKKLKLRRLLGTGGAIMFKGSGFYQTDYRSDSYKKAAAADKPSGGESSASGSSDAAKSSGSTKSSDTSQSAKTPKSSKKPKSND